MTAVLDRDLTAQPATEAAAPAPAPVPGVCLVRLMQASGNGCGHASGSCKPEGCHLC